MAKKKPIPVKSARKGKRVCDKPATPMERLQATVFVIRDQAKTRPSNCLIGATPADTMEACIDIIHMIATQERANICITNPNVLKTVVHALYHAKDETQSLWEAARGVAEAGNG